MAPQIREYTAQVDTLRPSETGVEATAMEGRRIGVYGEQAANTIRQSAADVARATETRARAVGQEAKTFGEVGTDITQAASQTQDFLAHKEIGQLTPVISQRMSTLSDQYQDALGKADPAHADMAIAQFNENTLEPALQQLEDSASSPQAKKFVQDHINQLREHYYEKQSADKAQLAGIAVKNGLATSDNAWSNTAYGDPSALDGLIGKNGKPGLIDTSITGLVDSNPNLRGVQGQTLKIDMTYTAKVNAVHSAFLGALGKTGDPDGLVKQFEQRYGDYIKPAELQSMATAAKMQTKANALQDKQLEAFNRQQQNDAVEAATNKTMADNVTADANGNLTINPKMIKDVLDLTKKYPDSPKAAETARTIINWTESQQKRGDKAITDDPATIRDLTDRMFDPNNPTSHLDILKADAAEKLSKPTRERLTALQKELAETPIREPVFRNAMAYAKQQIGDDKLSLNPGQYEAFVADFTKRYLDARRTGTLEPNALNINDEKSLVRTVLDGYQANTGDALKAAIAAAGGPNTTGKPAPKPNTNLGTITGIKVENAPAPKVGERKQFKQGWGVWNGTTWVPEKQ